MNWDISVEDLAQETFELVNEFDCLPEHETEHSLEDLPCQPGLIFYIDNSQHSFIIRGVACSSIKQSYDKINEGNAELIHSLRLTDLEQWKNLHFFETDSVEQAEHIKKLMLFQRIPKEEGTLLNISDPGFSWWMESSGEHLHIYFCTPSFQSKNYTRLGPLGDMKSAQKYFFELRELCEHFFGLEEFSFQHRSFYLKTSNLNHLAFLSLRDLLIKGVSRLRREDFPDNKTGANLYSYLTSLAKARQFWLSIESLSN